MKKILLLFNQGQDFTVTPVVDCLVEWMQFYSDPRKTGIVLDYRRARLWCDFIYNAEIRRAIEEGYSHIFQFDCDMTAKPQLLIDLLEKQVPCAGPLFFSRYAPFKPQCWMVNNDEDGNCQNHVEITNPAVFEEALAEKKDLPMDVRATGMTLFELALLKPLGPEFGKNRPNQFIPGGWDGWDVDVTWRLTRRYGQGAVLTVCNPDHEVKHVAQFPVSEKSYFQELESEHGNRKA